MSGRFAARLSLMAAIESQRKDQYERHDREQSDEDEAEAETPRCALDVAHRERPGEAGEIPDRVDEWDPAGCSRPGEKLARERPEDREEAEDADSGDRKCHHLTNAVSDRVTV